MQHIIRRSDNRNDIKIHEFNFADRFRSDDDGHRVRLPKFHWERDEASEGFDRPPVIFKRFDFSILDDTTVYGQPHDEEPPPEAFDFPFFDEDERKRIEELGQREQRISLASAESCHVPMKLRPRPPQSTRQSGAQQPDIQPPTADNDLQASQDDNAELRAEHQKLQRELDQMREQMTAARAEIQDLETRKGEVQEELDGLRQERDQAREDAEQILQQAREESRETAAQAEQQAREQAEKDVLEREKQREQERNQQYAETLDKLARSAARYEEAYMSAESDLVELAVHIARNVVNAELESNRLVILGQAKKAIGELVQRQQVHIKVAPADLDALEAQRSDLRSSFADLRSIDISPESSLEPGSCIVETDYGSVQADVRESLDRIAQNLRGTEGS